jgi:hypothetical protein
MDDVPMNQSLTPPPTYDPTQQLVSTGKVVRWLLVNHPGEVFTVADVAYLMGRPVSRQSVHDAVETLRREPFGLRVEGVYGGGYRLVRG